ncbi:enbp1 protein [Anaeramoeba flamelloides]|uniref:Enbp1 protein n=1 Tax=Anaeramoeba flamelloides TaxID=1746091 RepID=A0ABQ8Z8H3_9EUKA|nr:enbp1 protein [Anaeramoeba flamelloides]
MSRVFSKTVSTPVEIPSLAKKQKRKFILPVRSKSDRTSIRSYSGLVVPEPIKIRKIRPPSINWNYEKFSLEIDDIISSNRKNNLFFPCYPEEKRNKKKLKRKLKKKNNNKNNKQNQNKNTNKMEMDLEHREQEGFKIKTNPNNKKEKEKDKENNKYNGNNSTNMIFEEKENEKFKIKTKTKTKNENLNEIEKQTYLQIQKHKHKEKEKHKQKQKEKEKEKEKQNNLEYNDYIETKSSTSKLLNNYPFFSNETLSILQSEFELEMDLDLEENIKPIVGDDNNNENMLFDNLPFSPPNRTKCPLIMDYNFLKIGKQIDHK